MCTSGRMLMVTTVVCLFASVVLSDGVSPPLKISDVKTNGTYGQPCESPTDCDLAGEQFCDVVDGVCRCLPNRAYDKIGYACRRTRCESEYDYTLEKYTSSGCPDGFECYESLCTRFCANNDYSCHIKPDIRRREDETYLVAIYVTTVIIVAFFGILLLSCLYRRCKRFRCKRVTSQHGQAVLISSSKDPLKGSETPTKVFSMCFCAAPVTTSTPYMQNMAPAPAPVVSQAPNTSPPPNYQQASVGAEPLLSADSTD